MKCAIGRSLGLRAATYAGAERGTQSFLVAGKLESFFQRTPDTAALIDNSKLDFFICALLRAENAAIGFCVFENVADYFAQAVGERCSHFELVALRDKPREAVILLMDHAPKQLSGLGNTMIEFCSRQRSDGKPGCAARDRAGRIAHGDAEPLEPT
jgi:hypothetical protein